MQSGSGLLSWQAIGLQTAYYVVQYIPGGTATLIAQLGPTASTFTASGPFPQPMYCYLVAASASPTSFALSDMLCRMPGSQSGQSVGALTLRLNQSQTASFTWAAASGLFSDYQLIAVPLDGAPARTTTIASSQTSVSDSTGNRPTCYLLVTRNGGAVVGVTDAVCAIPGVSTLATTTAAGTPASLPSLDAALRMIPQRFGR